jgi:hypothetical protein
MCEHGHLNLLRACRHRASLFVLLIHEVLHCIRYRTAATALKPSLLTRCESVGRMKTALTFVHAAAYKNVLSRKEERVFYSWQDDTISGRRRPDAAAFVPLLLDAGANPIAQTSLRREVQYDDKHFVPEHRNAPPTWGATPRTRVRRARMEFVGAGALSRFPSERPSFRPSDRRGTSGPFIDCQYPT